MGLGDTKLGKNESLEIASSPIVVGVVVGAIILDRLGKKWWEGHGESFQLQIGFSFPFLRAKDLRLSLLNIRARSFLISCT